MKERRSLPWRLLAASVALSLAVGCGSSTTIYSQPPGATVYVDGKRVGTTPYLYSDVKPLGAQTRVRVAMSGYEPVDDVLRRDERWELLPVVSGVFLMFLPWPWAMGYHPEREYVLPHR